MVLYQEDFLKIELNVGKKLQLTDDLIWEMNI